MRHASLFSGIGGPEVAAAMLGWENVFHCEINEFGRKVLEYWFPDSDSYEDITKTDFTKYRGTIDVLTGGFPCQPFSYAGKRGGDNDQRYLWPEMLRVINEIRPTWVIGENVAGISTMVESCEITDMGSEATLFEKSGGIHRYTAEYAFTIERICNDLESKGYSVQPMLIPACAVGAPHRRDRIFFIANNVADSINKGSMRESTANAAKEGKERISERNEVQWTNEPAGTRSSAESLVTDSECLRLQHNMVRGSQRGMLEEKGEGRERSISEQVQFVEATSERKSFADTDCNRGREIHQHIQSEFPDGQEFICNGWKRYASDSGSEGLERQNESRSGERGEWLQVRRNLAGYYRKAALRPQEKWLAFPTVSAVHRRNDGIPFNVDCLTILFGKWRTESIKAYGNAIVPQVMYRIFEAIEAVEANR